MVVGRRGEGEGEGSVAGGKQERHLLSRSREVSEDRAGLDELSPLPSSEGGGGASTSSVVSGMGMDGSNSSAMDAFGKKKRLVEEIQTGILKFNLKPAKGVAYLVELGHLENTPLAVAQFLFQNQDRLNKTVVGDYLGRERDYQDGFCLQVLHEYVNIIDFAGMEFSEAIRYFLRGFFLPGEAQKIDRIMERFAERYYIQNKKEFASADMAFILAFSTIMLQTNLHPAIRDDKRMTKDQFIKQNKGISTDGELSDAMLVRIYDRIAAEPISIKDAKEDVKSKRAKEDSGFTVFQATADKRRMNAFDDERREMMKQVRNNMNKRVSTRPTAAATAALRRKTIGMRLALALGGRGVAGEGERLRTRQSRVANRPFRRARLPSPDPCMRWHGLLSWAC